MAALRHAGAAEVVACDLHAMPLRIATEVGATATARADRPDDLGNVAVTRELELRGSFRFDTEFDEALSLLAQGLPVDPVVTHTFPLEASVAAFETARDRTVASKVLLDLSDRA